MTGITAAGGLLLLVSTFLPWSRRGPGSAIALRRVADLILSGRVLDAIPRWTGLVVYAIPFGGALLLVGAGLGGRSGTVVGAAGVAAATVGTVLAVLALTRLDRTEVGAGGAIAALGALLGVLGVALGTRRGREEPSPSHGVTAP